MITAPGPRHGEVITVRTPTTVYGVLEFVSGTIFNLGLSWDVAGLRRINEVELHGTEATLFDTSPSDSAASCAPSASMASRSTSARGSTG